MRERPIGPGFWVVPVGETYDGLLNDINGFHLRDEHVFQALASAHGETLDEGNVGGGTGMTCHGLKGGIGTASRLVRHAGQDAHYPRRHARRHDSDTRVPLNSPTRCTASSNFSNFFNMI